MVSAPGRGRVREVAGTVPQGTSRRLKGHRPATSRFFARTQTPLRSPEACRVREKLVRLLGRWGIAQDPSATLRGLRRHSTLSQPSITPSQVKKFGRREKKTGSPCLVCRKYLQREKVLGGKKGNIIRLSKFGACGYAWVAICACSCRKYMSDFCKSLCASRSLLKVFSPLPFHPAQSSGCLQAWPQL